MSLRNEARPSVTTPATNLELSTDDRDRSGKLRRIALTAGKSATALLATGALVFGATACGTNEKPAPRAEAATSAPATPGATETQNPSEVVEGAGSETSAPESLPTTQRPDLYQGRIDPNTLVGLSHEQLVQLAEITKEQAATPDQFAPLFIKHLEAWANAGATPEEAAKYANRNGVYEQDMQDRYDEAFAEGLFGPYKDQANQASVLAQDHYQFLERYYGSFYNGGPNQTVKIDYTGHKVIKAYTDGSYDLQINTSFSDNFGEGMDKPGMNPYHHDGSITVSYSDRNGDGVYEVAVSNYDLFGDLSNQ